MHWIEDVSDLFCRCVDWIWLEGLYWRVSILLGREEGGRREEMMGEDERARGRDVHMHEVRYLPYCQEAVLDSESDWALTWM